MSDQTEVQNEVEQEETVEVSPVQELVNQITDGDLAKAETSFKGIIDDKIQDALDAQRVAVAGAIFNDSDPEEIEVDEDESVLGAIEDIMDEDEENLANIPDNDDSEET